MYSPSSGLSEEPTEKGSIHKKQLDGNDSHQSDQGDSGHEEVYFTEPTEKSINGGKGKTKNVADISVDPIDMLDEIVDLPQYVQGHKMMLTFPQKLMLALTYVERECAKAGKNPEQAALSWIQDGKAFVIRKKAKFCGEWMRLFFGEAKLSSFTRKLYRWGFRKINMQGGAEMPANLFYFGNEHFRRDDKKLLSKMQSITAAKTRSREAKTVPSAEYHQQQGQVLTTSTSGFNNSALPVQNINAAVAPIPAIDPMTILQTLGLVLQQPTMLSSPQSAVPQLNSWATQINSLSQPIQANSTPEVQLFQNLLAICSQAPGQQQIQQLATAWMAVLAQSQQQASIPYQQTLQGGSDNSSPPSVTLQFPVPPSYQMNLQQPPLLQNPQLVPPTSSVATNAAIDPSVLLFLGQLLVSHQQLQQTLPQLAPPLQQQQQVPVAQWSAPPQEAVALLNLPQLLQQQNNIQNAQSIPASLFPPSIVQILHQNSSATGSKNQRENADAPHPQPNF